MTQNNAKQDQSRIREVKQERKLRFPPHFGNLEPEDIIENQKITLAHFSEELEQLQKENRQLKEELRIARSDRQDAETAIANYFINHWRTGHEKE